MNMKVTAVLVIAIALVATLMYSLQQGPSEVPQAEKQWVDKDSQPQTSRSGT